jgi:signal transduction histidine kinase
VDRAKTVFFSNVSHEFRTPLTLMLGPLEDMLAKPDEEVYPANRELLKVIHRSCLRLQKLVNTLLDFARIEAGRTQANYEPTDLAALTTDIASAFRSTIERAGMKLIVDCAPQGEQVYVDREMWEKIVMNLLSNAFKFTFEGEIQVCLRQVDGRAELSVRDTGIGIAAAELPYIFERFHRVKNLRGRSFEGSGIGLALVQELVQLHKGEVSAASAPNQGSTFTVSVPMGFAHIPAERLGVGRSQWFTAVQAHSYIEEALRWLPDGDADSSRTKGPDPGPAEVSGESAATGSSGSRLRILLADDNADLRNYVGRLLSFGYDVEAVPDGEAALESALQNPPSLVLADVMMPKLDGFGLLKALRADQRTATIPTILLSARAGEESRLEGIGAGADDYLVKPFSSRELVIRVETHLHLSRLRREAENRFRTLAESLDAEVRLRTKELEERNAYVLRQSEQMRNLSQRLMQIQDAERRHIARELHDSAGQTLAALGMSLGSLGHLAKESDPKLAEQAEDSQQLVQQLSQEIRTMSYLLHPPLLDETGLSAALSWYVRGLSERSGLNVNLDIPDDFGRLPRDMELMIFRVVQECLTNIHRHSGSRVAHIRIARANRSVAVEIRDEGKGMAAEKLAEIQSQGSGVGIRGMRERVYQFQGDITMESDGHGTRIVAKVPIPVSEAPGPNVAPLHATG